MVARSPGRGRVRGRHERDRLRVVPDDVGGEDGLIVDDEVDHVLAGNVGGGQDHDAGPVEGRVALDPEEAGVRLAGPDGGTEPGAREDEVIRVSGATGELLGSLATGHGPTDHGPGRGCREFRGCRGCRGTPDRDLGLGSRRAAGVGHAPTMTKRPAGVKGRW